jgi:hypothetical protein
MGKLVRVATGDGVSLSVEIGVFVLVAIIVDVAETLVTPITTGVGVKIEGVGVEGKKGVGPGRGWIIQPLQDDNTNIKRIGRINFLIFFSSKSFYPSCGVKQSPPMDSF